MAFSIPDGFQLAYGPDGNLILIRNDFAPTQIRPSNLNPPRVQNVPLRSGGGGGRSNSLGSRPHGGGGPAQGLIKPETVPMPVSPEPNYPLPPQFQPPPMEPAPDYAPPAEAPDTFDPFKYQRYLPRTQGVDAGSFDDTPSYRTPIARPGTAGYLAGQAMIGAAQGGHNVSEANQAELYSMGFPVEPPSNGGDPQAMNQEVYGQRQVQAPNPLVKYLGAGINALASNPFAAAQPNPLAILRGIAGSGIGGQMASDLFPNSKIAPLLGSVAGGFTGAVASPKLAARGAGTLVSRGVQAAEDNVAPVETNLSDRINNRQAPQGVAVDPQWDVEPPGGRPPVPPMAELPLEVQDQIARAKWFSDPTSYANAASENKHLPINVYDPPSVQHAANIESQRLFEQWKAWKDAGYLRDEPPGGSAGAAVTPKSQLDGSHPEYTFGPDTHDPVQYQADNYTTPSATMSPEDAAGQMKDLTGIQRVVDSHGKLGDANYKAMTFNPNPDLSRPTVNHNPHMTRMAGETPEDFVKRVSQNFNGAQHIAYIQQELNKLQPFADEAKSARALNNYMEDHLQNGGPDMTSPEKMTRQNLSDFIRKLTQDQQREALTGQPHLQTDRMFPDAKPPLLGDIHPEDIGKLKSLRDSLPITNPLNTSEQALADSLGRHRNYFNMDDPMAHKYAMDRIGIETDMTPDQVKSALGDIQDKLAYHSGDPKDLAEHFYWAKKNIKTDGDGGTRGSLSAAATPDYLINDYTPTTDLARQHFMTRDGAIPLSEPRGYNEPTNQRGITKIMEERFANPDKMNTLHSRMSQDAITREMAKRYMADGMKISTDIHLPPPPAPQPPRKPINLTPPPMRLNPEQAAVQNSDMLSRLNAKHSLGRMASELEQPMAAVKQRLRDALNKQMGPMSDREFNDFLKKWYE